MKNNKNIFMYSGIMHSIENDSMQPLITKVPDPQLKTSKEPSRWYKVIEKDNEKELNIGVVVEDFRAGFYYSFIFMLGVSFTLTKCFTDVDHTGIIKSVFGASNICTYFDFAPSTYIIPCLWVFVMMFGITYDLMSIFRVWIAKEEGKMSRKALILLVASHIYYIVTLILFSLIFAVSPDREHPETMTVHTIPYINLKVALCILQLAVVWFGVKVGWVDLELPKMFVVLSWLHVVLQFIVMMISNVMIINALGDTGKAKLEGKGLWWDVHDEKQIIVLDWLANYLSFILNILLPLIQSQYLSSRGFRSHALIISIGDNKDAKIK